MTAAFLAIPFAGLLAAGEPMVEVVKLVDVIDTLHNGAKREIFTEGPAVDAKGDVWFSDEAHKPESRILHWSVSAKKLTVGYEKANRANGMTFDRQGRLLTCEGSRNPGGTRRVARYEADGKITVLAETYDGKKLNSPNDVVVDAQDRVWFTDPRYVAGDVLEQPGEFVYRIDNPGAANSKVVRVLGPGEVVRPNGICVSPDGKTLYVADSPQSTLEGSKRLLLAYDIAGDGSLANRRVVHDFGKGRGIDGMRIDRKGLIYGTAGVAGKVSDAGIYVFDPNPNIQGKSLLRVIPVPETPGNCCWGGEDGRTLYVTASRSLYSMRLDTPGYVVFPAKWPAEK